METKITVIMPSLNVAPYIEECIKSVIGQTLLDIEIICVDAGSTDGTLELLERFERLDSRIRIIHSDKKSYGYQVNIGIREAEGAYIGIVETDDFIASDMYEKLYDIALEYNLDYVKGEYSSFLSINEKEKYLWGNLRMTEHRKLYNKVVCSREIPYIYAKDMSVWGGIYKKELLIKNNIWFNESLGASYQDIGFLQQTIGCASRAWYCDQSFYRYRVDRDGSSVKSPKGLNFSRTEFERIITDRNLYNNIISREGFYTRMLASFLVELKKVIPMVSFDMKSLFVKDSFTWFVDELRENYQYSIFEKDKKEFECILKDENVYLDILKNKNEQIINNRKKIINTIQNQRFIIFGAGIRGGVALNFMLSHKCRPVAFCDNDENKLTDSSNSLPILTLQTCMEIYPNAFYIIANKKYALDINMQLRSEGIEESRILIFE